MKTTFKVILTVLVVAFYSCKSNIENESSSSSITSDGLFSGKIVNYDSSLIDSIKVYDSSYSSSILGKSSITNDGKFSMTLLIPKLRKIGTEIGIMKSLTVSDSTALIGNIIIRTFKRGVWKADLQRCNINMDSVQTAGTSYTYFIYVDRAITIKGTENYSYSSEEYSKNLTFICNLKNKKGWNEWVAKIDSDATTKTCYTFKMSITNTITSDLQWILIPMPYYNGAKQKVKRQKGLNSLDLFCE